jgi:hypothetical protein
MSNGLALTRTVSSQKNELYFQIVEKCGNVISIKQTVYEKNGKQVKILIDAPENVKITRGELLNK